jgi:Domain of unknown function (DUF4112)
MHASRVEVTPSVQESVARLEALARLMDGAFVLPGTNIRFGLDGIVGLVPVAGDLISGLVSTYPPLRQEGLGLAFRNCDRG